MRLLTASEPVVPPVDAAPAIQLEGVSVRYRVPHERVLSFREYTIRRLRLQGMSYEDFWALRSVSLEIQRGEVLGVVGANGSGKSTLLKVISRVIRPKSGRVRVRGRVAPLLELGAGFDYELTGRENVFLNGAILGFSRRDMEARFKRIVDFAELWDFIDTPLRKYSAGMIARLGFAVATDVEPDILIIDEILGVGDQAFQEKSVGRIRQFRDRGTTILLVSHNPTSIRQMCDRAAWLSHGELKAVGPVDDVLERYLHKIPSE